MHYFSSSLKLCWYQLSCICESYIIQASSNVFYELAIGLEAVFVLGPREIVKYGSWLLQK